MKQRKAAALFLSGILSLAGSISSVAPMAHAATGWNVNLLTNPSFETGDFTGWTAVTGPGINFPSMLDDGWAVTGSDYAHKGSHGIISSYGWDKMYQEIDLVAAGYSTTTLDSAPTINFSTWVAGHWPNASDLYDVKVELRNGSHSVIETTFDTGVKTAAGDHRWTKVSHTFDRYGDQLRYIYVELKGHDAEFWAGQYGTVFDDSSVTLSAPKSRGTWMYKRFRDLPLTNNSPCSQSGNSTNDVATGC